MKHDMASCSVNFLGIYSKIKMLANNDASEAVSVEFSSVKNII